MKLSKNHRFKLNFANSNIFLYHMTIIAFVRKHLLTALHMYLCVCQVGVGGHGPAHGLFLLSWAASSSATVPAEKKCRPNKAAYFFLISLFGINLVPIFEHTDLLWAGQILLFNIPSWNKITAYFRTHNLIVNSRELHIPKKLTARADSSWI